MNDPFVIDTFQLGQPDGGADAPTPSRDALPTIAQLPWLATPKSAPPREETTRRFDAAESPLTGVHVDEALDAPIDSGPTRLAREGLRPSPVDPTAIIRVDTVAPDTIDEGAQESVKPRAAEARPAVPPEEADALTVSPTAVGQDPWTNWLLELEAAVLPHARWIVLAAIVAALGLSAILLSGAPSPPATDGLAPQVSLDAGDASIAIDDTGAGYRDLPAEWPAPDADERLVADADLAPTGSVDRGGLAPLDGAGSFAADPPAYGSPIASGPASAARRGGYARLSGDVLNPAEATERVATRPELTGPASARAAYPRTAVAPETSTRGSVTR